MVKRQQELDFSPYRELYNIIVKEDNFWRLFHDDIDFSFLREELDSKYSPDMGRSAVDPVMMFKYCILKVVSKLSDIDLVEEVRVNMAYKYFLDMAPEESPVDDTTICKFRRQRMADTDLLDMLLTKTFQLAEDKGLLVRSSDNKFHIRAIIDGTHTLSYAGFHFPVDALKNITKRIRKNLRILDESIGEEIDDDINILTSDLRSEIEYCQALTEYIKVRFPIMSENPLIRRDMNSLAEAIEDIRYYCSIDRDARIGHKSADTRFFGYKTQIIEDADSGLIVGAEVTSGESSDAVPGLKAVEHLLENEDVKIEELIGDTAYSGQSFLDAAEDNGFELIASPHPNLGANIDGRNGFTFNKDADMFICPAGNLAISKRKVTYTNDHNRQRLIYKFDNKKCAVCLLKEDCLKRAKFKTFSLSCLTKQQKELLEKSNTQDFKRRRRERYKIEAKNAHLKNGLGYGKAQGLGIQQMELQASITMFVSNVKKIYARKAKK